MAIRLTNKKTGKSILMVKKPTPPPKKYPGSVKRRLA